MRLSWPPQKACRFSWVGGPNASDQSQTLLRVVRGPSAAPDGPPHLFGRRYNQLEALAPLPFVAQFFRPTNGGDAQLAYEPCA